jgi:WAS/WASL-interacting protein
LPPPVQPPPHPQTSPRRAPAPPRRASPLSSSAWRRALLRPPQAPSPPPPPRPWVRGAKAATSRGEPGPHRSPPPPPRLTTSTLQSRERRVPAARAAGTPRSFVPGTLAAGGFAPSYAPPAPAPTAALHARALDIGGWAGRTARCSRPLSAKEQAKSQDMPTPCESAEEGEAEVHLPTGRRGAW